MVGQQTGAWTLTYPLLNNQYWNCLDVSGCPHSWYDYVLMSCALENSSQSFRWRFVLPILLSIFFLSIIEWETTVIKRQANAQVKHTLEENLNSLSKKIERASSIEFWVRAMARRFSKRVANSFNTSRANTLEAAIQESLKVPLIKRLGQPEVFAVEFPEGNLSGRIKVCKGANLREKNSYFLRNRRYSPPSLC